MTERLHKELGDLFCMIKLTEDNLGLDFNKTFGYSNDKYQKLKIIKSTLGGSSSMNDMQLEVRSIMNWFDSIGGMITLMNRHGVWARGNEKEKELSRIMNHLRNQVR